MECDGRLDASHKRREEALDHVTEPVRAGKRRVEEEHYHLSELRDASDRFRSRVSDLDPPTGPGPDAAGENDGGGLATVIGTVHGTTTSPPTRGDVVTAFVDTVRQHSVADLDEHEPLAATLRAELGDDLAIALAADADAPLTAALQTSVRDDATEHLREIDATAAALAAETTSLASIEEGVETILEDVATADRTPLSRLGFDELRARHEALGENQRTCELLAVNRQTFLGDTTATDHGCRVEHDALRAYLYGGDDHPGIATLGRLTRLLEDCRRTVRAHLTRAV